MGNENNIKLKSMLRKGTMLHGTYRIDGYLSSGGFGNTYVATHVNFNKQYAIKEFFMDGVNERVGDSTTVRVSNASKVEEFKGQRAKFYKEAQRLHELSNSHIVRVHDLFDENGTTYYVMDYIDGESLKERLRRTGQPMSEQEVEDVLRQVLDALGEVHSQGLYHMDLKPANIMIDSKGVVKLIDFGASKQFNTEKGGALSTSAVTYTNGYAPREQMERNYQKFGPWTDFYALGATLYNVLSNRTPPMPTDIDDDRTPDKHLALPKPANVSTRMWDLVLWMLKTHRQDRPQSVADITTHLNGNKDTIRIVEDKTRPAEEKTKPAFEQTNPVRVEPVVVQPVAPKPEPAPKPVSKPKQQSASAPTPKRNLKTIVIAACAGLALVIGGYAIFGGKHEPLPAPDPEEETPAPPVEASTQQVTDEKIMLSAGGCTYSGEVNAEGMPDGTGTARFDNGDVCEGTFVDGIISGDNIRFTYANGDTFVGSYKDNEPYQGRYTLSEDGSYSEGLFKDIYAGNTAWYDKNGKKL